MGIVHILDRLIIQPLGLLFDVIYAFALRFVTPGFAIIALSLAINLLVLPLYKRADELQEEEKETASRLKRGVEHIKKTFHGDERFMMLQTYYKQNNYKTYYALKGSLSLILQVPFFIAAYRFLSELQLLQNYAFGPIADMGKPDGLLHLFGYSINLLPILMTLINIVSGAIYTRGMPLKGKIQLYGMALIFLILLYDSPAGLVFYWTLNNLFSLGKNIYSKSRTIKKCMPIIILAIGAVMTVGGLFLIITGHTLSKCLFVTLAGAVIVLISLIRMWCRKHRDKADEMMAKLPEEKNSKKLFYICCIVMTIITGVLIPSAIIGDSPGEFVSMMMYTTPLHYIWETVLIAAGFFLVWFVVFYRLSSTGSKKIFSLIMAVLVFCSIVNYMFFGTGYGNISSYLRYDQAITVNVGEILKNAGILIAVAALVYFIWKKKEILLRIISLSACAAVIGMSVMNISSIHSAEAGIMESVANARARKASIPLDKSGKNVMVIMLDRAINQFVPYILEELPELQKQFAGFTYYPNTISYGFHTNVGVPPLYGGYEYTPEEMDKRADELLVDKHNEALKVMPTIFVDNGYKVTVCDPPYANYEWVSDISVYDDCPGVTAYVTEGTLWDDEWKDEEGETRRNRDFFCYSIFRTSPVLLHGVLYNDGNYNDAEVNYRQENSESLKSPTLTQPFWDSYHVLFNLPYITDVTDNGQNTFLLFCNNATHEQVVLAEPSYDPTQKFDNTKYDADHEVRRSIEGKEMTFTSDYQREHYPANAAAMIQLGKWFDYLRANGLYDNTRIIIASDHGSYLGDLFNMIFDEERDVSCCNPLLMVKDFGATEFKIDYSFMTNADAPTLSMEGIINDPVNPFTGKKIENSLKNTGVQRVYSTSWDTKTNNGTQYADPIVYVLKGYDMTDLSNWSIEQ